MRELLRTLKPNLVTGHVEYTFTLINKVWQPETLISNICKLKFLHIEIRASLSLS